MLNDLISIIVPVYNISSYLQNSISSLQNQSHRNIEIIAVDDGSVDDSLHVLQEMAKSDDRIHVIHQDNGGVTKARMTGVTESHGEWIGFMDGDDYVEPDMYERLLMNAQKYHADISHCGYRMVFPSRVDYYYNTGRLIRQNQETGLKDLLEGSFIEPGLCNKLFHKTLLHSLFHSGKMDCSIKNMEDLLMNYYIFREAKLSVYEDFCPYHYMVRKGSAATGAINEHKLCDPLLVWKIIREDCSDNPILLSTVNKRLVSCLIGLATVPHGEHEPLVKKYRAHARQELRAMLPELMREPYSNRTKLHSVWAAVWPESYSFVHSMYARLRGTDKKFEVK